MIWPQPTRVLPVSLATQSYEFAESWPTGTLGWLPVSDGSLDDHALPGSMAKVVVASGTFTAADLLAIEMVVEMLRTNPPTCGKPGRRQPAAYWGVVK
jgi:hypothetical protein